MGETKLMPCYCMPVIHEFQIENYVEYENFLYQIFKNNFIENTICFNNKPVRIKRDPILHDKVDAFYHIICGNEGLGPEPERCKRISWVHSFILNYKKCKIHKGCSGVKIWVAPYRDKRGLKSRIKFLSTEGKYFVILEDRQDYYMLITAYYIDANHRLKKLIDEYNLYKITGSAYY